jgi:cell division protein FtsB
MISRSTQFVIGAIVCGSIATFIVLQQRALVRLRQQNHSLERQIAITHEGPALSPSEAPLDTNELMRLRAEQKELIKLRGEVTVLRRERDGLSNQLATAKIRSAAQPLSQNVDTGWVQQVLQSSPAQQGLMAGALRGKLVRGEGTNISSSELALQKALSPGQLNQTLERTPEQFADFQTAFIQGTLGLSDATKLQQIHDLIRQTYDRAVANGLDIPSKPAIDTDAWVQRRFQLDRQATAAMEHLLTPEEWQVFGRAFIGVMGVDLGSGGVDKSNYPKGFLGP